jgi:hypothetical protein
VIWRVAVCLLVLPAGVASAQQARRPAERPRDELYKFVDAYIVSNLQESLALSDEQFVKVLPLVKKLQADRRSFVERRHGLMKEMRELLEAGQASEVRIKDLLQQLKALENEEPGTLRRDADALDAALSPVQQAKVRILEVQVEQKMRELLSRVRSQGAPDRRRDVQ